MATEIKAPTFPESVAEGTVATWHKKQGEPCSRDELLVEIETDKVILEVVAPVDGVLSSVLKQEGDEVLSDEVIAELTEGAVTKPAVEAQTQVDDTPASQDEGPVLNPAARRLAQEKGVDPVVLKGTGKGGRITKEDVLRHIDQADSGSAQAAVPAAAIETRSLSVATDGRIEKRVPMTRLRARVAQRLVDAQQTAAMLTTFNEVNMKPVMDLRAKYKIHLKKIMVSVWASCLSLSKLVQKH